MKLAELIIEGTEDKLTTNLLSFLQKKFEAAKGVTFELEPIQGLRKMFNIPEGITKCIRMAVSSKRGLSSARKYLAAVIGQRFPDDNILNVTVRLIHTEDGYLIVLQQDLNEDVSEGRNKLLKKIVLQIQQLMEGLAHDLQKSLDELAGDGSKSPKPFRVDIHQLPAGYHGASIHLVKNPNISDGVWEELPDTVKETLDDEGIIGGVLPLDVSVKFYQDYASISVR